MIKIVKINESFFYLENLPHNIFKIICENLSVYQDGYQFTPAYRMGQWDGKIRFYKFQDNKLIVPYGFLNVIENFLNKNKLKYQKENFNKTFIFDEEHFDNFIKNLNLPFEPYDYQLEGAKTILKEKRKILQAATGAGKSYLTYLAVRYLHEIGKKTLIIVPNIPLTLQLQSDFKSYGWNNVDEEVKLIGGEFNNKDLDTHKTIISTWQSLSRINPEEFKKIDAVITDECLHPKTKIKTINGEKFIRDIKVGDIVLTYNEKNKNFEFKPVLEIYKNLSKNENMYEIQLENGDLLKITGNHKVLTQRGWIRADELTLEDEILEIPENNIEITSLDDLKNFLKSFKDNLDILTRKKKTIILDKIFNVIPKLKKFKGKVKFFNFYWYVLKYYPFKNFELLFAEYDIKGRKISKFEDIKKDFLKNNCGLTEENISGLKNFTRIKKFLLKYGLENNICYNMDKKEFVDYLFGTDKCKVCGNSIKRKFSKIAKKQFAICSKECDSKLKSERMKGKNNSYFKTSKETRERIAKINSKIMKEKIKNGEFTPCVTNSWARSRCIIDNLKFRSSWEALFYLINKNLQYEKIRIPYINSKGINRNYIVDFCDNKNKILYEIKPESMKESKNNILKEKFAKQWCKENDFIFKYIDDNWFITNIEKIEKEFNKVKNDLDGETKRKMERAIKIFKKGKNEN